MADDRSNALGAAKIGATLVDDLQALLTETVSANLSVREAHGRDESWHEAAAPDLVVFPRSTEEVANVVKRCAASRTPVVAYGAGTSLEGHVMASRGGVCVDLSRMNQVLEVNVEDLDCRVEAGVTRKGLAAHLRDSGLFFPVDPGADATLGGMTATAASGTNAVRYGTMRENVLGLTVVLADGTVIRTGGRARKSAAGYDLTGLMVGSEGTLGIITEVALRLYGAPEKVVAGVVAFPDMAAAVNAVIVTIQLGVPMARIELVDPVQIAACNAYSKLDLAVAPTLFVEFHGSDASVAADVARFEDIVAQHDGGPLAIASETEDRNRLWTARHNALYAAKALAPGKKAIITDVCVPISRLAACILETQADADSHGILAPIVGHVGDGNFHMMMLFDADNAQETQNARALHDRMVLRALDMGGTCTGEHGVGEGKKDFLLQEHGQGGVDLMRRIKQSLDPLGILNPGKVAS